MMNNDKMVACRLNSSELLNRKQNVIAKIKKNILKRLELENGYEYHFNGSNETLDQLIEFIKLERQCCDFFTFQIQLEDEKVQTVLSITGPKNAKEFIRLELDL